MRHPFREPWRPAPSLQELSAWLRSPEALPALALLALPLVLLLANASFLWDNPLYFDTNVYVGFFRHYLDFKLPYIANYKSSRLPFVLPGVVLYRLLPAEVAHHLLHLGFLWGETLGIYALVKRRFGAPAAFLVAAAVVTSTYSHTLTSYHNQAASTYFILALLLLEWPAPWPFLRRAALAGGALAWGGTTDSIVGLLVPMFLLHLVAAVPRPLGLRRIAGALGAGAGGGVAATVLLGLLNRSLGGPFLFFLEQVHYSADIAKLGALSRVALGGFLTNIDRFPWLALPLVVAVASFCRLALSAWRRQFDAMALETGGYLISLGLAVVAEARGLGLLEEHCLFHVLLAPMYLALGGLVGAGVPASGAGGAGATSAASAPSRRFILLVSACFVVPLSLLGAPLSRLLLDMGRRVPVLDRGVPIAFGLAAIAGALAWRLRRRWAPAAPVAIAGALGLMNAVCTEPSQPAHLYQIGDACPFRGETFDALLEADGVISRFDPENEARWQSMPEPFESPQFDGHDWCHLLPLDTVSRSALLTHYFYTSNELVRGVAARPLKKVILAGMSADQMDQMVAGMKTGVPPGYRVELRVDTQFVHSTFSLFMRGFDIEPATAAAPSK